MTIHVTLGGVLEVLGVVAGLWFVAQLAHAVWLLFWWGK